MTQTIFKILRVAEWREFADKGSFAGSPDDQRDGFIHMSSADQVRGTLDKHFASEQEIVLAAFDEAAFGEALKYERSRGGALFPHIHGTPLTTGAVTAWARISRGHKGFELPEWCEAQA